MANNRYKDGALKCSWMLIIMLVCNGLTVSWTSASVCVANFTNREVELTFRRNYAFNARKPVNQLRSEIMNMTSESFEGALADSVSTFLLIRRRCGTNLSRNKKLQNVSAMLTPM